MTAAGMHHGRLFYLRLLRSRVLVLTLVLPLPSPKGFIRLAVGFNPASFTGIGARRPSCLEQIPEEPLKHYDVGIKTPLMSGSCMEQVFVLCDFKRTLNVCVPASTSTVSAM